MNLLTIPRAAARGYLKLLRVPVNAALGTLGLNGRARIVADRADATARDFAGTALADNGLRDEAARRRVATAQREHALEVRELADEREQRAEQEAAELKQKAAARREQVAARTAERKQRVQQRREGERKRAQAGAQKRSQANERVVERAQEAVEEQARRARLEQLDAEAGALAQREQAVTADDEADRLKRATERAKEARKR